MFRYIQSQDHFLNLANFPEIETEKQKSVRIQVTFKTYVYHRRLAFDYNSPASSVQTPES